MVLESTPALSPERMERRLGIAQVQEAIRRLAEGIIGKFIGRNRPGGRKLDKIAANIRS